MNQNRSQKEKTLYTWFLVFLCVSPLLLGFVYNKYAYGETKAKEKIETIVVSAEGLVDMNADLYKKDRGLMMDDLRLDARRQVIEKAVGAFVESSTLVENYAVINSRVCSKSKGIIKRIIKESKPWPGEDGFMHLLLKAEVYLAEVKEALNDISRDSRIDLIKQAGNPKISTSIVVKDADRSNAKRIEERSEVAENILKELFRGFGYRVWSENSSHSPAKPDFSVYGQVKFKRLSLTLKASGLKITKYALTSWTVKCVDNYTGEEIYFNNKVPKKKTWSDEDGALEAIGNLIGSEFTKDFFETHLMLPSRIIQLQIQGMPDYETGLLLKRELIGLRSVLNVDFRNYCAGGLSEFEVDFAGSRENFTQRINETVIKPLNKKLGENSFKLIAARGNVIHVRFKTEGDITTFVANLNTLPPASLANAAPERIERLVKDKETLKNVSKINPEAVDKLERGSEKSFRKSGLKSVKDF